MVNQNMTKKKIQDNRQNLASILTAIFLILCKSLSQETRAFYCAHFWEQGLAVLIVLN